MRRPPRTGRAPMDAATASNAILAKRFSSEFQFAAYFSNSHIRSYLCTAVRHVVVCTAHLKPGGQRQTCETRNHQCRQLQPHLAHTGLPDDFRRRRQPPPVRRQRRPRGAELRAQQLRRHQRRRREPSLVGRCEASSRSISRNAVQADLAVASRRKSPTPTTGDCCTRLERRHSSKAISGSESGCLGAIRW